MNGIGSMTRSDIKSGIGVFLVDSIDSGSIAKAEKMLAGIKHGADKAVGAAIKYATKSAEAYAAKAIADDYYISAHDFKAYTKHKRRIESHGGQTSVDIEFRGYHIPLVRFSTKIDSSGRVTAKVKKNSSGAVLEHVFLQTVGTHGHTGLFERVTEKRLPIEEKVGPSTPQMMSANDDVSQAIGDKIAEAFDGRIDHEINAILKGYW